MAKTKNKKPPYSPGDVVDWHAPNGLIVECDVKAVQAVFGRFDLELVPATGAGSGWVRSENVKPVKGQSDT